jgi:Uncharacterised nucleotidyltransferase
LRRLINADILRGCLAGHAGQILSGLSEADQNALLLNAVEQGVAPWYYSRLRSSVLPQPSSTFLARLHESYLLNHLRNLTVWRQLREVLEELRDVGIPVILLKGAHLAEIVYGEPALRPMSDLDLLVKKGDLLRTWQLLLGLGYSPLSVSDEPDYEQHHHIRPVCKAGAIPIEIHHTIEPPGASFAINIDHFWSRAQDAVVAGVQARVLCPEDLLLHLCLHSAYNHRFQVRMLQLWDIAVSIRHYDRRIDWQRLAATSNKYKVSRFVFSCLLLVAETFGVDEIPPSVFEALHHESGDREVVRRVREFLFSAPDPLPVMQQRLGESKSVLEKIRVLARTLFPTPREMREIYQLPASRWVFPYYLVRPVDLLLRRGRFLPDLVFRTKRLRPALEWEENRLLIYRWVEDCAGPQPGGCDRTGRGV